MLLDEKTYPSSLKTNFKLLFHSSLRRTSCHHRLSLNKSAWLSVTFRSYDKMMSSAMNEHEKMA